MNVCCNCEASIIYTKYHTVSVRMLFRECNCKNVGVAGYAEAFTIVLSEKHTSETDGYLVWIILGNSYKLTMQNNVTI